MWIQSLAGLRGGPLLAIVAILAGCASGPRIVTNSAPDFNLVDFRTFGFLQPLSSDRGNVRSLISTHLIDATTRELEMAGLRHVDRDADLMVNFFVSTRETISTRSTPSSSVSMNHRRGRYGTWGGYSMSMSTTEVVQRTEGTISVDIIDAARNQLVWEGAATGRVTDSVRQNIEEVAHDAIAEMFVQFP